MKFTKYTFLMLGLASLFSVSRTNDAFAADCDKAANSGKFCKTWGSNNYECRPGCYCPGGSNKEAGAHDVKRACDERWSNTDMWKQLNAAQIWLCPDTHPDSDAKASKKTDCYKVTDNGKVYYSESTASSSNSSSSSATEITVNKGTYLPKNSETPITCTNTTMVSGVSFASNWYCPGGKFTKSSIKNQGIESCPTGTIPSQDKKQCEEPSIVHCEMGWYMPENSPTCAKCNFFMYCPGGNFKAYHTVDGSDWACSIPLFNNNELFNIVDLRGTEDNLVIPPLDNGKCEKMKNAVVTCPKGRYLAKLRRFCDPCPENTVCKGGTFHLSLYEDQGLGETCTAPAHPNNDTGKCVRNTVYCAEGTYLPANKTSSNDCKACPSGKLCPGGDFETGWDKKQGILDKNSITINPGYYLPKASTESKKCTGTSKYCPGGTFEPSASRDQGQFDCPTGSRATDDKSACAVTLTKKQMMYGTNGTGGRYSENAVQCWTKTGTDYKACMGFKTDGTWTAPQSSGSTAGSGKNFYIKFEEKMPAVSIGSKVNLFMGGAQK
jgi:hypothetical protein